MNEQTKNMKFDCTQVFGFGDLLKIFKPIKKVEVVEQGIIFCSRFDEQSVDWRDVEKVWIDSIEKFLRHKKYFRKILNIKIKLTIYKFLVCDELSYAGVKESNQLLEEIKKYKPIETLTPKRMLIFPWWYWLIGLSIVYFIDKTNFNGTIKLTVTLIVLIIFLSQGFIYKKTN